MGDRQEPVWEETCNRFDGLRAVFVLFFSPLEKGALLSNDWLPLSGASIKELGQCAKSEGVRRVACHLDRFVCCATK